MAILNGDPSNAACLLRGLLVSTSAGAYLAAMPAMGQEAEDEQLVQSTIEVIADPVGLLEDRPTDSLFGLNKSALETPRSVSIVSSTTIDRYAIEDIDDFITTTPGTFGGSFFGVPGAITVRGSISETYFRGFKRTLNQGLFPTPIGSTERVEIIRGPVPVIYGAGRVGGLLNFYPKTSQSDGQSAADGISGSVAYTGGSYDKNNVAIEFNAPFLLGGRETGLALYGELEDSESFYNGREPEHDLLQAAFTHDLGNGWSMELGGMYFNSEGYLQSPGWNRLTQDLIDNGTYITGTDTDLTDLNMNGILDPSDIDAVVGTSFGASNIRTLIDFGVFGFPDAYGLDENVGTTQLDRQNIFIDETTITESESVTLYADVEKSFDDDSELSFQLFYDKTDAPLNVGYGFASDNFAEVTEGRVNYAFSRDLTDSLTADVFTTASYRDYSSELSEYFLTGYLVLDRRDLSAGPTATDTFATPLTDPTIPWDSVFISEYTDIGFAATVDFKLMDKISLLVGARYDEYEVESRDEGATNFGDPVFGDTSADDVSYSASLSYISDKGIVPYITYAESASIEYNANGGITPARAQGDDFLADSELTEVGVKFALLDARLNGSIAYYEQERDRQDAFGNIDRELSEGIEAELRWLITDNFTLTSAVTEQKFVISAPGPGNGEYVVIPPTHPSVNAFGQTLTGAEGYGGLFAALNAGSLPELVNGYERNVIPDSVYSLFGTYTANDVAVFDEIGATFGATYVSETGGKTTGAVVLPEYTVFRAGVFGTFEEITLTAVVDNVFDEEYFQPVQGVYEEVAAMPGQGRTVMVTAKYAF